MAIQSIDSDVNYLDMNNAKHIDHYMTDEKTLAYISPKGIFSKLRDNKRYVVCLLTKDKKKHTYYAPVYQTYDLDYAIFAYNNTHVIQLLKDKRQRNLFQKETKKDSLIIASEMVIFTDKQLIVKPKDLVVYIIPIDQDELCP